MVLTLAYQMRSAITRAMIFIFQLLVKSSGMFIRCQAWGVGCCGRAPFLRSAFSVLER